MIVKEDFLNKTRRYFGLNLYEARVWTALLSRGVSTAGELSDIGNVPRSRTYDILESLEKKGFVVMKIGKPIKYVAIDPNEVVERVKKNIHNIAKEDVKKLDDLKKDELLGELVLLHKQGIEFVEPTDLSGAIRGRNNIYMHLESMIKNAKNSVTIFTTSKGLMRKIEALKPELERLGKKGVKIRIAAPMNKEIGKQLKNLGKFMEVKDAKDFTARFALVDNKELMFMIMHDDDVHPSYDIGIWVNTPYFTSAMNSMVEKQWGKMNTAKI